jgi:hypothetical protein
LADGPGERAPERVEEAAVPSEAAAGREDAMARAYARARERDAIARAQLRPLAPGERPAALVVAAALAAAIGVGNIVLLAAGWDVRGGDPSTPGVLLFAALMLAAAVGMWQRRYWAVLAFEALLGIGVTYAGLSLLVATNVAAIVLCLTIMVGGGLLFWKLVRVMGRIQVAARRRHEPVG